MCGSVFLGGILCDCCFGFFRICRPIAYSVLSGFRSVGVCSRGVDINIKKKQHTCAPSLAQERVALRRQMGAFPPPPFPVALSRHCGLRWCVRYIYAHGIDWVGGPTQKKRRLGTQHTRLCMHTHTHINMTGGRRGRAVCTHTINLHLNPPSRSSPYIYTHIYTIYTNLPGGGGGRWRQRGDFGRLEEPADALQGEHGLRGGGDHLCVGW